MGNVYDVEQHVGFPDFVEGGFKGIDKVCGKFADEPYRVCQQEGEIVDNHFPNGSVERGKQFVFRKNLAFAQKVHES